MTEPSASATTRIEAPAARVYALVSDLPGLSEVAAEFERGRWLSGGTEPRVGARFRGHNRSGWRRWWTTATVTDAEPGVRFAFDIAAAGMPVAHWRYDFTPTESGCEVTESMWDRRPGWFKPLGDLAFGAGDRVALVQRNIEHTLAGLKSVAESDDR